MKSRYFSGCVLCGQAGHRRAACPKHIPGRLSCSVCASADHRPAECPNRLCDRCWQFVHPGSECQVVSCSHCNVKGHALWTCPWKVSYTAEDLADLTCYVCGGTGHLECGELPPEAKLPPQCCQCGQVGHRAAKCPGNGSRGVSGGSGKDGPRRWPATGGRSNKQNKDTPRAGDAVVANSDLRPTKRRRIRPKKGDVIEGERWGKARDRLDQGFAVQPFSGGRYAALTIPV